MKNNKEAMKKVNRRLIDLTDTILTGKSCFFLWGEPEVPEKLSSYYKNKKGRDIKK